MTEEVGILLAVGVFLLWCGLFGFLNYFESLNVSVIILYLECLGGHPVFHTLEHRET